MSAKYRFRRGFNGACVLQVLRDFPYCNGFHVDASVRVLEWCDVNWSHLPPDITVTDESLVYMPERKVTPERDSAADYERDVYLSDSGPAFPPIFASLLIEACCCSEPGINIERIWNSPAGQEWRAFMRTAELIDSDGRATARGHAHLARMLDLDLPGAGVPLEGGVG